MMRSPLHLYQKNVFMVTYVENLNVSMCVTLSIWEINIYGRYKFFIVVKFAFLPHMFISTGNKFVNKYSRS